MAELNATAPLATAPLGTRRRGSMFRLSPVMCTLVLFIMIGLIVYPMALLVYSSFLVPLPGGRTEIGLDLWLTAWTQSGMVDAVLNTFKRVAVTEVIAFPAAVLIAWLVTRTNLPGKSIIDMFFWVAFFLPALPVLMGWILLFDPELGLANHVAKSWFGMKQSPFNIYTFWGIIFAHLAARSVAAKYIFLAPAFRNLNASMEEASYIAGASALWTIWRIVVPVLMPAFLITLAISLIHSLESFEIELILGPPTGFYVFSTKIYQLIRQDPPLFGAATVLSLAILVSMLPLIFWQQHLSSTRSYVTVTSQFSTSVLRLGTLRWPLFALIMTLCSLITIVPLIFLVMGTFMSLFGYFDIGEVWTLKHWADVLSDSQLIGAILNTLVMGAAAAVIGVVWYAIVAYVSVRTTYRARGAIDFLSWLPASLPGVVLGLALLWMFLSVPVLRPLYGTVLVLVVACILTSISTGVQLIKGNMIQLGRDLEEASFVTGGSWFYTFRRVVLPLLGPVLVSVALLTFVAAARNVATIAMLVTGANRPLAMLQADYMVDGRFEAAAVAGVIIVILTLGITMLARAVGRRFGMSGLSR